MKKIVIAPDSFKGGFKQAHAGGHLVNARHKYQFPDQVSKHMAATAGTTRVTKVTGPTGQSAYASWVWIAETYTAIIDSNEVCGAHVVPVELLDASRSSSYGMGELILAALDLGATKLVLNMGTTATNDAGAGMLRALGARFYDTAGFPIAPGGLALQRLSTIDLQGFDRRLDNVDFQVIATSIEPLCGKDGVTYITGRRSGSDKEVLSRLDAALAHFANRTAELLGCDHRYAEGAGAAGGMGFAAKVYLGARIER